MEEGPKDPAPASALPLWQSHKRVHAAKIAEIVYHDNAEDSCYALRFEGDVEPVIVTPGWLNRYNPRVGGYYVVYLDGYASFSPAGPFEEGYTRVNELERDSLQQARAFHAQKQTR